METMNAEMIPEFKAQVDYSASVLAESSEDSLSIEGADNKLLVKLGSRLAREMIDASRVLFPYAVGDKEYLVCIKEVNS